MIVQLLFALSILFTGLFAGIGFANLLGYMPAFRRMKQAHALAMWQSVDIYFRACMPFVGISLQLILLLTLIGLYKNWNAMAFVLVGLSFLLSIAELAIIKNKNLPLNIRIQEAGEKVPADFETMRVKAIKTFNLRGVIDIVSFILVITAWMEYNMHLT